MTKQSKQPETQSSRRWHPSRRQFLIGLGGGAAALAVGAVLGGPTVLREARLAINQAFLTGDAPLGELPKSPFIWFEIDQANRAHLYIPKIEMGQGIHTTLAQIAADELELDWETVVVHQADTMRGFDPELIFTFGSTSTTALYRPIREIAATMREMLKLEAAQQLGVGVAQLVPAGSAWALADAPQTRLTYGEVVAAKQGQWVVPESAVPESAVPLKTSAEFRYIGQSTPRVDLHNKVTGRAVYGYDVRVPGMLYGAVARPPRYNAILKSAAAGDAAQQPGVIQVVIQAGFAGVVAETRAQAYAALEHLDLEWESGSNISQAELEAIVTVPASGGTLIQRSGNIEAGLREGTLVSAEYRVPMAAHAHLEPQAALAEVQADEAVIHVSTQAPGLTRDAVAKAIGIDAAKIRVIPTYLGGAFGRKTGADAGVEAAILAQAVGRPVHVGWNRTEEMRYGYRRPPAHNVLRASIDAEGSIQAMEHQLASSDVLFYVNNLQGSSFLETLLAADPLAAYGSLIHYGIPHRSVTYHHTRIPVPTAFWRGLGSFPNTFAIESFVDEVAHAAGVDPLELRLKHLPEGELGKRYETVLTTLAERCNWSAPAPEGRARGLAAAYDRGTVVGLVMEISVEANKIRTHRAWCAVDPGLVVNPDGAAAQVEGSIMMALSSTFYEQLTVENGMITAENFNTYPLLTIADAPTVEVITINSSDEPVGGLGEPVVGTVPAAVANAVFALTGQRLRSLPLQLT